VVLQESHIDASTSTSTSRAGSPGPGSSVARVGSRQGPRSVSPPRSDTSRSRRRDGDRETHGFDQDRNRDRSVGRGNTQSKRERLKLISGTVAGTATGIQDAGGNTVLPHAIERGRGTMILALDGGTTIVTVQSGGIMRRGVVLGTIRTEIVNENEVVVTETGSGIGIGRRSGTGGVGTVGRIEIGMGITIGGDRWCSGITRPMMLIRDGIFGI
jgi:hypothetical protein